MKYCLNVLYTMIFLISIKNHKYIKIKILNNHFEFLELNFIN